MDGRYFVVTSSSSLNVLRNGLGTCGDEEAVPFGQFVTDDLEEPVYHLSPSSTIKCSLNVVAGSELVATDEGPLTTSSYHIEDPVSS